MVEALRRPQIGTLPKSASAFCRPDTIAMNTSFIRCAYALGIPLRANRPQLDGLPSQALERAIGVIYRPETEFQSHYFHANLVEQFDAIYHFDVTRAVQPLERSALWQEGEVPEAYPTGE